MAFRKNLEINEITEGDPEKGLGGFEHFEFEAEI